MACARQITALMFATIASSAARADDPVHVRVSGDDSGCPRPADVAALLVHIAPSVELTDDDPQARFVWVSDLGAGYRVAIDGVGKNFDDPARTCSERAKASAVFAALVLGGGAAPPVVEPRPVGTVLRPTALLPAPPPPSRTTVDVELNLVLDGNHTHGLGYAGAARLSVGRGLLSGSIGFLAGSAGNAGWEDRERLRVTRFVPDASLRVSGLVGQLELGGELGVSPLVTYAWWKPIFDRDASTTVSLVFAVRAAFSLRLWFTPRIGLHAGLQALIATSPIELSGVESGASLTYYWLGGVLGLVVRAR